MGSEGGEEWVDLGYVNWIQSIYTASGLSAFSEPVLYAKVRDTTSNKTCSHSVIAHGLWVG